MKYNNVIGEEVEVRRHRVLQLPGIAFTSISYAKVCVDGGFRGAVGVSIHDQQMAPQDLREAAAFFNELADVLEGK